MPRAFDSAAAIDSIAFTVTYPDDARPWEEMWQVLEYAFGALERRYVSDELPFPAGLLRNDALIFSLVCHHLADHLWCDPNVPLTKKQVGAEIDQTTDLLLVQDFSNSLKHHTRHAGLRLVRVRSFTTDPRSMRVGWTENGVIKERDGLDLARGAMADWRKILHLAGLL